MRFANNAAGQRICADAANKSETYCCPTCNQPLVFKRGKVIPAHFAHFPNKPCTDDWEYEETPWMQEWQSKFPEENREVIVAHSGQSHRADILAGNDVVLFQESAITEKFFLEKTKFFQHDGRHVFWVINAKEDIDAGILRTNPRDKSGMFWDHPPLFLVGIDLKADKQLHIILDMGNGNVRKVEWIAPESGFERFLVDGTFTPDLVSAEGRREAAMNQYGRFEALKEKHRPWKKKISSTNGAPDRRWHTCEKTGAYHCDECKHCEFNLINEYRSANQKSGTPGGLYFYCCYPASKQEMVAGENGKAKAAVPSIWLK